MFNKLVDHLEEDFNKLQNIPKGSRRNKLDESVKEGRTDVDDLIGNSYKIEGEEYGVFFSNEGYIELYTQGDPKGELSGKVVAQFPYPEEGETVRASDGEGFELYFDSNYLEFIQDDRVLTTLDFDELVDDDFDDDPLDDHDPRSEEEGYAEERDNPEMYRRGDESVNETSCNQCGRSFEPSELTTDEGGFHYCDSCNSERSGRKNMNKREWDGDMPKPDESVKEGIEIGTIVGYHGREGAVKSIEGSTAIVYFSDTDEEEAIEIEDLKQQDDSLEEDQVADGDITDIPDDTDTPVREEG